MSYFGSPLSIFMMMLLILADNIITQGGSWWIAIWVSASEGQQLSHVAGYIGVYAAFAFAESVIFGMVYLMFENGAWNAGRTLHRQLISSVLGAPLSWFNTIPVGRVINRLSRDVNSIDKSVAAMLRHFLYTVVMLICRIGAIGFILPIFMVPAAAVCFIGIIIGEIYTRVAVTVKKLVSSAQSPMFTQFSDTLEGLSVIRARSNMPEVFGQLLAEKLRAWCRAATTNYNCNRWIAVRVDFLTASVSLAAGMIAVSQAGIIAAGLVGFSLMNATGLSGTILGLVRSMNDLEIEMQSVSRTFSAKELCRGC